MTKVLVAYASEHGSAAEIAQAVGEPLREGGLSVDGVEGGEVGLEPYDAVVLGSAVYMERWRGDAKRFLRQSGPPMQIDFLPLVTMATTYARVGWQLVLETYASTVSGITHDLFHRCPQAAPEVVGHATVAVDRASLKSISSLGSS